MLCEEVARELLVVKGEFKKLTRMKENNTKFFTILLMAGRDSPS